METPTISVCPLAEDGVQKFPCPSPRRGRGSEDRKCIDDNKLCDGHDDCDSGEDEDATMCLFYSAVRKPIFSTIILTLNFRFSQPFYICFKGKVKLK